MCVFYKLGIRLISRREAKEEADARASHPGSYFSFSRGSFFFASPVTGAEGGKKQRRLGDHVERVSGLAERKWRTRLGAVGE